jgi:NhaP-type Na+/H+ or K+/H+ antiporter
MFALWCLIVGGLLVLMGLSHTHRQHLPISASAIYLMAGYLLGPDGFGLLSFDLVRDAALLEMLTETAVLVSLFAVGLRLRMPLTESLWITPATWASAAMLITIALMTGVGLAIGLSLGMALLLAAVLAPTDPVLASDVQVAHPGDRDRMRFSLTAEGGLNDGTAFPFVMLALGLLGLKELGPFGLRWWAVDVLWATAAGLGIGWLLGRALRRTVLYLRRERERALGMESFLTLGLIAVAYGSAVFVSAYGFLAVFAAGLAMRHIERHAHEGVDEGVEAGTAAEAATSARAAASAHAALEPAAAVHPQKASAYIATAALEFTLDLERLAELTVMLVIGSLLTPAAFSAPSLVVAFALVFVARPAAIYLCTRGGALTPLQRRMAAWFGIRGIGSMYYLAYALAHGAVTAQTPMVADAVLATVALSVLLHGSSATPVMALYRRIRPGGPPSSAA